MSTHGSEEKQSEKLPLVVSVKTKTHARELRNWRRVNRGVPWGVLIRDALDLYFQKNGRKAA